MHLNFKNDQINKDNLFKKADAPKGLNFVKILIFFGEIKHFLTPFFKQSTQIKFDCI